MLPKTQKMDASQDVKEGLILYQDEKAQNPARYILKTGYVLPMQLHPRTEPVSGHSFSIYVMIFHQYYARHTRGVVGPWPSFACEAWSFRKRYYAAPHSLSRGVRAR